MAWILKSLIKIFKTPFTCDHFTSSSAACSLKKFRACVKKGCLLEASGGKYQNDLLEVLWNEFLMQLEAKIEWIFTGLKLWKLQWKLHFLSCENRKNILWHKRVNKANMLCFRRDKKLIKDTLRFILTFWEEITIKIPKIF